MRASKYISTQYIHTIFGVLVALFVLTHAVALDRQIEKSKDSQEQKKSKESDSQQVTEAVAIASASPQLSLDYQSYCLGEVFTKDQNENIQTDIKNVLNVTQKAIGVILRRIISPNAP